MSPSLPRLSALRTLLTISTVLSVASACTEDLTGFHSDERSDDGDLLYDSNGYRNNPMVIPYTEAFDMCFSGPEDTRPAAGYGVDLNIAKWLAFFAANEYAHYAHFAPVIEQMGFGDVGEGEDWVNQARNVLVTRYEEEQGNIPNGGSALFERDVIQTVTPGKKIQFFAAGEIITEDGHEFFNDESTQMLWVEHRTEPVVVISFRGTEMKYEDIAADLVAWKTPRDGYGDVHSGFQSAYEGVEDILKEKLRAESGRGLQIWITGHSLGGALASLASTTIMDHIKNDSSYNLRGIYTFGMPRVGNESYQTAVEVGYVANDVRAMRFRNGDDVVTQVPWQWMGYRQTGKLMHLDTQSFQFNPTEQDPGDTGEDVSAIDDHRIPTYHSRISSFFTSPYQDLGQICAPK